MVGVSALGSFQCCDMVGRQLGHLTCEKPAAVIPDISVWGNLAQPEVTPLEKASCTETECVWCR